MRNSNSGAHYKNTNKQEWFPSVLLHTEGAGITWPLSSHLGNPSSLLPLIWRKYSENKLSGRKQAPKQWEKKVAVQTH